jgi:hypothetical protein
LGGTSLLVQQDVIAYVVAGTGLWLVIVGLLVRREDKGLWFWRSLQFGIGTAVAAGVSAVWLASHGALAGYVQHAFVIPLRRYDTFNFGKFVAPWRPPPLSDGVTSGWDRFGLGGPFRWFNYTVPFYLVPLSYVVAFAVVAWRWMTGRPITARWQAVLLVALLGFFLYRPVYKTADETKLHVNSVPAAILMVGCLVGIGAREGASRAARMLSTVGLLVFVAFCLYPTARTEARAMKAGAVPVEARIDGGADAARVIEYLQAADVGSSLFSYPGYPLAYVRLNVNNPTVFDYLDPIIDTEADQRAAASLAKDPPRYCVWCRRMRFWGKWELGENFGMAVDAEVRRLYRPVFESGDFVVLARRDVAVANSQ